MSYNRGLIGVRATDPTNNNRANTYTLDGVYHDVVDVYSSSIHPTRWVKNKFSNFNTEKFFNNKLNTNSLNLGITSTVPNWGIGNLYFNESGSLRSGYVSANGEYLYVASATTVYQFELNTPWDITTASYLRAQAPGTEILITSVQFAPDGNTMFIVGQTRDTIASYPLTESWNVQTIGAATVCSTFGARTNLYGMTFSDDGNHLLIGEYTNKEILKWTLSSPYTLTAAQQPGTFSGYFNFTSLYSQPSAQGGLWGFQYNSDGTKLIICGHPAANYQDWPIISLKLKTPYDINTAFYETKTSVNELIGGTPLVGGTNFPWSGNAGIYIGKQGTRLYIFTKWLVYQVDLPAPYSLATYDQQQVYSFLRAITDGQGFYIKPDGTYLYITDRTDDTVYQYGLSTPWDISTAELLRTKKYLIYQDDFPINLIDTDTQENNSTDIKFSVDGTKMYIVGPKQYIFQYTLNTAWDIDTAVYANKSFYLGEYEDTPTGIHFSNDGSELYVLGTTQNHIYKFRLTTAWDISTTTFYFKDLTQDTEVVGPVFSDDGSKFFLLGITTDTLYEYTANTNYEVLDGTLTGNTYTFTTESTAPVDFNFVDSGSKLYILDGTSKTIYKYELSTPWDITTISYANNFRTVSTAETTPTAFDFNDNGSKLFVIGSTLNRVIEYDLKTPWDLHTTYMREPIATPPTYFRLDGAVLGTTPEILWRTIRFKPDGTRMYLGGQTHDRIVQYDLQYPWNPRTAIKPYNNLDAFNLNAGFTINWLSGTANKLFIAQSDATNGSLVEYTLETPGKVYSAIYENISQTLTGVGVQSARFSDDGRRVFVLSTNGGDSVNQYDLASPWSLGSITANGVFNFAALETAPTALDFTPDGTKMFIVGQTNDRVYQFDLDEPWNVLTARTSIFYISPETATTSLYLSPDGTKFFIIGSTNDRIYGYDLTIPYEISSAGGGVQYPASGTQPTSFGNLLISGVEATATGLYFSNTGTELYVIGSTSDKIHQYSMSTPWDIANATFTFSTIALVQDTVPTDIFISDSGTNLYTIGITNDRVYQYSLSTAWDLSTLSFVRFFSTGAQDAEPRGIHFRDDGTRMFIVGQTNDRIYQYNLGTAWDISTAVYNTFTSISAIGSNLATPDGLRFSYDGTAAYVCQGNFIEQFALSTAWDITTIFTRYRYSVATQTGAPTGLKFKSDGSRMYISAAAAVYQYDLSSSWNVGTASYVSSYNTTNIENAVNGINLANNGTELYITGTQIDVMIRLPLQEAWNVASAYYEPEMSLNLLSTMSETSVQDFSFNDDGTKLIVIGNSSRKIQRYDLSEAWNVQTASANNSTTFINPTSLTAGIVANNGLSLYAAAIFGRVTPANVIFQIDMSSEFSAEQLSIPFAPIYTSANQNEDGITGVFFRDDGTRMFAIGVGLDRIKQYNLSVPWDLGSAVYAGNTSLILSGGQDTNPRGLWMRSDRYFYIGTTSDTLRRHNMATAWTITSGVTYSQNTVALSSGDATPEAVHFRPEGNVFFIVGGTSDTIRQYGVASAFTATGTPTLQKSFYIGDIETSPTGIRFNDPDGTKMYVCGVSSKTIHEFVLTDPYQIDTATLNFSFEAAMITENPQEITFSTDGTIMFLVGATRNSVYRFDLSTAWDISTARIAILDTELTTVEPRPGGIAFANNGHTMFVIGYQNRNLYEYYLPDPYNLRSPSGQQPAELVKTQSISAIDTLPLSLDIRPSGNQLFSVAYTTQKIINVDLVENYNVQTITPNRLNVSSTRASSLLLEDNDTKLYITDKSLANSKILQYNLGVASNSGSGVLTVDKNLPFANIDTLHISDSANSFYLSNPNSEIIRFQTGGTPYDLANISVEGSVSILETANNKWSEYFSNVSADYAYVEHSGFSLGTGDFTVDFWFYSEPSTDYVGLLDFRPVNTNGRYISIFYTSNRPAVSPAQQLYVYINSASRVYFPLVTNNEWHHVTILRKSGVIKMYLNGVEGPSTYADALEYTVPANRPVIGSTGFTLNTQKLKGFVSNLKLVVGEAIVPSTNDKIPSSNTANTVLLAFSTANTLLDVSGNYSINKPLRGSTRFAPSVEIQSQGLFYSPYGNAFYTVGTSTNEVHQYNLSTAFQTNTASYYGNLSIAVEDSEPTSLYFNNTGTELYVMGIANNKIYQYNLATPWDITTGTYKSNPAEDGEWSNYFGGTDYITTGASADLALGSGDFTIECWVYPTDLSTTRAIASSRAVAGTATLYWSLTILNTGSLQLQTRTAAGVQYYATSPTSSVSTNTWTHVAATRSSGTIKVYVNGIESETTANDSGLNLTEQYVAIGLFNFTGFIQYFSGFISNFRVVKGSAIYNSNFTPSTTPLTTTSQGALSSEVELLTCQSNTFIDNSLNNFTLSRGPDGGKLSVESFSPFYTAPGLKASVSLDDTLETSYGGIYVNRAGQYVYVIGSLKNTIYKFTLSTPHELSSISNTYQSFSVSSQTTNASSLYFSQYGDKLFVLSAATPVSVYEYSLSVPWDITTATYNNTSFNISGQVTLPTGIFIRNTGDYLYVIDATADDITEYLLPTTWSLNSASYVKDIKLTSTLNTSATYTQVHSPQDFTFAEDGEYLLVLGNGEIPVGNVAGAGGLRPIGNVNTLHVRNLQTTYNTQTIGDGVLTLGFDATYTTVNASGFSVKHDGSKMWLLDSERSRIIQYNRKMIANTA